MKSVYDDQVSGEMLEIGEKVICIRSKHPQIETCSLYQLVKGKTYTIFDRHHYSGQFIYKLEADGLIIDWIEQADFPWNINLDLRYEDPRYFISVTEFREEKLNELGI